MRIGIDYTPAVHQGGGIGRYVRELVRALAALDQETSYLLFIAGPSDRFARPALPPNFSLRFSPLSDRWLARLWHRLRLPLPVERFTGPLDLFHATDFVLPPTRPGTRTLLTVHDLSFVRAPETATPALRRYLNRVVPRSVARADHVLADSQATREDLIALYGAPAEKVTVLYSGVDARFIPRQEPGERGRLRTRYGLPDAPFILSVGTLQPRKNYVRLIRAFHRLTAMGVTWEGTPPHLVIAGGRGWLFDAIFAEGERLGVADRVHFPGFIADEDLPALYRSASLFAFPSLYEGFGLPLLEAMACGVPVVASNASSLPEVVGEAGLLVEPTDVEGMARAMARLLSDRPLREALVRRGLDQARRFTWSKAAEQLVALYRRLLSDDRPSPSR